jgi:hypothetical protein
MGPAWANYSGENSSKIVCNYSSVVRQWPDILGSAILFLFTPPQATHGQERKMPTRKSRLGSVVFAPLLILTLVGTVRAQSETIFTGIGADTQLVFSHTSIPGATGIDFSFAGAFAPMYPPEESHLVVIVFEWGPTATGPWTESPDHLNTVPGGMTDLYATGTYNGPEDAPFVAIHFYAGGLMTVSGTFDHISVPEPGGLFILLGSAALVRRRRAAF